MGTRVPPVPVSQLPETLRPVFRGFQGGHFNAVQSDCFDTVFKTDTSLLISAPTGSGKTGVFELAICRYT
jgi:ATP-dependent DNA helicase HFM1/MER3